MKIKKGDRVRVIAGKDRVRGHEGAVMAVLPEKDKIIVEGAGMAKRHQKPTKQTQQGGIIDKDMPIHVSNVMIVCASCGPTRIGRRVDAGGSKVRVCRKCGVEL